MGLHFRDGENKATKNLKHFVYVQIKHSVMRENFINLFIRKREITRVDIFIMRTFLINFSEDFIAITHAERKIITFKQPKLTTVNILPENEISQCLNKNKYFIIISSIIDENQINRFSVPPSHRPTVSRRAINRKVALKQNRHFPLISSNTGKCWLLSIAAVDGCVLFS